MKNPFASRNSRRNSAELKRELGEAFAEADAKVVGLTNVAFGGGKAGVSRALFDAKRLIPSDRGPGDARGAQIMKREVLLARVVDVQLVADDLRCEKALPQLHSALVVVGHPQHARTGALGVQARQDTSAPEALSS